MEYLLLIISLCLGVSKNVVPKCAGREFEGTERLSYVNIITSIFAMLLFGKPGACLDGIKDTEFVISALMYGLCILGSQSFYIIAAKNGSVSLCSLIYASCFVIPTVFSTLAFNEAFSVFRIIGIALMLFSVALVSVKGDVNSSNGKWYLVFAFMAMICAGLLGILQKTFSSKYGSENVNSYLFFSFLFMLIFSLVISFFSGKKYASAKRCGRKFYVCAFAAAVSIVVANKMNLYLAGALPGLVFFPVINGGTIMLSAVMSVILFKEKLRASAWVGILLGIFAIVLIAL